MFRWSGVEDLFLEDNYEFEDLFSAPLFQDNAWGDESLEGISDVESELADTEIVTKRDVDHALLTKAQERKLGLELQKAFCVLQKVLCQKPPLMDAMVGWVVNDNGDQDKTEQENIARDQIITLNDKMQVYEHLSLSHVVFQEKLIQIKRDIMNALAIFPFDRDAILLLAKDSIGGSSDRAFSARVEKVLARLYELRNQFVKTNVRLVYHVARRHLGKGLSLEDMVQEGVFGLMRAALKFDPALDIKFSTYAFWWIKQAIRQAIAKQRSLIRYPVHVNDQVNKVYAFRQEYLKTHGKLPTNKACQKALNLSAKQVKDILSLSNICVSADSPIHLDSKRTLLDDLSYESVVEPGEALSQKSEKNLVEQYLNGLTERERKVILMRYGIGMNKSYSLNEIAPQLGVSRERIRQIASEAIAKIRRTVNAQQDLD